MKKSASRIVELVELDARHDQLLDALDELDKRVSTVLGEQVDGRGVGEPRQQNG
ncbi:MAG: hypothetical protein HQ581_13510 [Planctomycetes bacterium]|nr:hypothetical protein [Planctomycetota bacterium]